MEQKLDCNHNAALHGCHCYREWYDPTLGICEPCSVACEAGPADAWCQDRCPAYVTHLGESTTSSEVTAAALSLASSTPTLLEYLAIIVPCLMLVVIISIVVLYLIRRRKKSSKAPIVKQDMQPHYLGEAAPLTAQADVTSVV